MGNCLSLIGGFCKSYHKTTGIAGYTLIFNSHGIRIKSHQPFQSVYAALTENKDIESKSELVETEKERLMVRDTDSGKKIKEDIDGLKMLLQAYRNGDFFSRCVIGIFDRKMRGQRKLTLPRIFFCIF